MFERGISRRWLHNAAVATYVFFGMYAFLGLAFVWYSAVRGDIVQALMGFGVALGSIGLGVAMHVIVQLAGVVGNQMEHLEALQQRADAAETLLQALAEMMPATTRSKDDVSRITAATVAEVAFPRIARDAHADTNAEATRRAASTRHDPETLRESFRTSMFAGDFAAALAIGSTIVREYPQGEMAEQFRTLRPTLEARLRTG